MFNLPSVVGKKDKRKQEENVGSDKDILNKKINDRLKRKEKLAKAMNKLHDADIAKWLITLQICFLKQHRLILLLQSTILWWL